VVLHAGWGAEFREMPISVREVRPELTGNYAVDREIMRSAGEANFMMLLYFSFVFGGWLAILGMGCKKVYQSCTRSTG
jgi:hypothetical protein